MATDWVHPGCDASELQGLPPSGACHGPVTYRYRDTCAPPSCATYNACESWDLVVVGDGLGYTTASSTVLGPSQQYTNTLFGSYGALPDDECPAEAAAKRAELLAQRAGMPAGAAAGFVVSWQVVDQRVLNEGGDLQGNDWYQDVGYRCQIAVAGYPTPITAVHPWCGCAAYAPSTCTAEDRGFAAGALPLAIPDNSAAGATAAIPVTGDLDLQRVTVSLQITHPRRDDLVVTLIAPWGESIELSRRVPGVGYHETERDVTTAFAARHATAGTWLLRVQDLATGNTGTIDQASLRITGWKTAITAVTLPPGSLVPASVGAPAPGASAREAVQPPTCQTCDAAAPTTDADAQRQLSCLEAQRAGATGELATALVAREKLLYALYGERLTAAQRARVEALYDQNPGASLACSPAVPWDAACQALATPLGLPGAMQRCADLAAISGTPSGMIALALQPCLDQVARSARLGAPTCQAQVRDLADASAQAVLGRSFPAIGPADDLTQKLGPVIAHVSAWWSAAHTVAGPDHGWLEGHANRVLRALWAKVEAATLPLPTGPFADDSAAGSYLAHAIDVGFHNDASVLAALFAAGQPASAVSPTLLALAGDALRPLAERAQRLAQIHDVACRFKPYSAALAGNGCHQAGTTSATSELIGALAAIPDATALTAALAHATHLAVQQPQIYAALAAMRDQHAYFDTAWTALGRGDTFARLAAMAAPPSEAAALAAIVRDAAVASASYERSGLFAGWHVPRLSTGILQQPALVGFISRLSASLGADADRYVGARLGLVNDLLAQSRTQGEIQSATDRMRALVQTDANLVERLVALDELDAAERAALATAHASFEALIASGALDANAAYQTRTLTPLQVSAAAARYTTSHPLDLVRDAIDTVTLQPGELVRLRVSGRWSPTCALRGAQLAGPSGALEPIRVADAETGPEGFWLSREVDGFSSRSTANASGWRVDFGVSFKACESVGLGLGFSPFEIKASNEACAHADFDYTWSGTTTDSGGTSTRTAASFGTGLRVPGTPFPWAPVGSLVAVVLPAGGSQMAQAIGVRVVHPDDVIVAPPGSPAEVRLFVNDAACGAPAAPALTIERVVTTPVGNVARAVSSAVSGALATLEAQAPRLLGAGVLSTEDAAALRAQAWRQVQDALTPLGLGLAGIPYDLRQLFDGAMERELASLGRRAQMHAISRERAQLQISADALAHDLGFATDQNRLQLLVPRWRLRDLSGVSLAQSVSALTEALTADAALVFELRDPGAFNQFGAQVQRNLDDLINVNLTAPYEVATAALKSFADGAATAIDHATFELGAPFIKTVAIAIPRSQAACAGTGCRYGAHGDWSAVSAATSAAFWRAAQGAPYAARIDLTPSDLYGVTGTGSFLCGDVAPVVRRMALYLDTGDNLIDVSALLLGARVVAAAPGAPAAFPLVARQLRVDADAPQGVGFDLPVLNGSDTDLGRKFGPPAGLGVGAGLSPFTGFSIDLTPFQSGTPRTALNAAKAVFLVFETEQRGTSQNVLVPGICQAAL